MSITQKKGQTLASINEVLLNSVQPGKILSVHIGVSRAAVLAETDDGIRCGLAAVLSNTDRDHKKEPPVKDAGRLHEMAYKDLASLIDSPSFVESSVGLAAINALLPGDPSSWMNIKGEDYLFEHGVNKNIAVVGHFPFVDRLNQTARNLWVLELRPRDGDLPAEAAPDIIPQADLVAITSTTLTNRTFQSLTDLCRPDAEKIMLGPSTPLSGVMYDFGIDLLAGTVVVSPEETLLGVSQGITTRQLHQNGCLRYISMKKAQPS